MCGISGKLYFKRALAGLLPERILHRPKMGFGVPIDHWLRHELREMAYETLLSTRAVARGYFQPGRVRRMLDEHVERKANWHYHLWMLLMLELWYRRFIDERGRA
jgi:asparagine synthase (glutamine-hydrolysing)